MQYNLVRCRCAGDLQLPQGGVAKIQPSDRPGLPRVLQPEVVLFADVEFFENLLENKQDINRKKQSVPARAKKAP